MTARKPNPHIDFRGECEHNAAVAAADPLLNQQTRDWFLQSCRHRYSYNFTWLGRPIIQYPQDMVALQELVWTVRPDLIVETGIAHGGSLILSASLLALLDLCEGRTDPRRVVGVDIDIREHNRQAIESHPLSSRITLIEGSSVAPQIVEQVQTLAAQASCVLVILDSNHTDEHVYQELHAYAPLVAIDSYCVVMDTVVELMPDEFFADRPWGRGNSPQTAVHRYLAEHPEFVIDKVLENKLLISVAPEGYLKRIG